MGVDLLPETIRANFDVEEHHHACAVMKIDFPSEWADLIAGLEQMRLPKSHLITPGGRKSPISLGIDAFFYGRGWEEKKFNIKVEVDGDTTLAPTHQVDYFKHRVAMETEWNNKDPFFDRDLTTFRLLFEMNVLSIGVIITRADELQQLFNELGRGASYGQSTTHMSKLVPKLKNRASGGCPVLSFGMRRVLYDPEC